MKRQALASDLIKEFGGMSVKQWDDSWDLVPKGFEIYQRHLRDKIGVWAAKRGNEFVYIAAAANMLGSGLSGGLARTYVRNPSGDKGWGLKQLRRHRADVDAYVIAMDRSPENIAIIGAIKKAMVLRHDPEWNRPEPIVSKAREASYKSRTES